MKLSKNLRKALSFLLIFIILFSNVLAAKNDNKAEESVVKESIQQVGPGTYFKQINWTTPNNKYNINVLETYIGTEFIKVEAGDNGRATGIATVSKQAESKYQNDSRVIGAINGDFFYTNELTGLPSGTCIVNGEIRTAIDSSTIFGVNSKGSCFIDELSMDAYAKIGRKKYDIAGVNRVRWDNQLILYTPAFSKPTNTKGTGTEIVIKGIELPVEANKQYTGIVEQIYNDVESIEIPEDGVVLSGQGAASEFLNNLREGDEVSFEVGFSRDDIIHAISGTPRLLDDGEVSEEVMKRSDALTRHPRTAIGIKGGQVMMVTVDGRQKGVSDGMTLYELAEYMQSQGIENAMNLDGGGSTAMIIRKQGNFAARLVNSPSDGRERSVANSIQIISHAPLSEPKTVVLEKNTLKIFKNSTYSPSAYALDAYFNRVDVESNKLKYSVSKDIGKIDKEGLYTAGNRAGKGYIDAALGDSKSRIEVEVFDKVASLKILNSYISLEPGEKIQMEIKAYDEKGGEIVINPSAVNWITSEDFGIVDKSGVFTAGKNMIEGKIAAKVDTVISSIDGRIGNMPIVLEGFEKDNNIELKSIRASVSGRLSKDKEPVMLGTSSYKFNYNLVTEEEGTAATYLNFKEKIKVPGKPIEIGAWVYGNTLGNWLRGTYINGNGEKKVVNYTSQGKLNWKGWKYVYAEIPKDEVYPIAIEQIYVAEPIEENKGEGVIYLDNLVALYKAGEDYYNPEVVEINIADKEELAEIPEELIIKVKDKGEGIDPKSIVLLIDNIQVKAEYEKDAITHKLSEKLYKGEHTLWLRLKDKAGNGLNPEFKQTFIVK